MIDEEQIEALAEFHRHEVHEALKSHPLRWAIYERARMGERIWFESSPTLTLAIIRDPMRVPVDRGIVVCAISREAKEMT
jgi:hypothetical protein